MLIQQIERCNGFRAVAAAAKLHDKEFCVIDQRFRRIGNDIGGRNSCQRNCASLCRGKDLPDEG